jgi:hypothetical protein
MTEETEVTAAEIADAEANSPVESEEIEEIESEEAETDTSDAESETAEVDEKQEALQRKIARMSYKERELKRQNTQLMEMLRNQQKPTTEAPKPPKLEDFESIDDFVDAKLQYALKQGQEQEAQPAQQDQNVDAVTFELNKDDLYSNGIAKYADFNEVVGAEHVDITPYMANAIFETIEDADLQVDTAYYLGNNPKEAAKIAKLPPVRQIAEVVKVSNKITAKKTGKQKAVSKAPAPIEPVGGKKTTSAEIGDKEDFESFLKKRNKQLGRA